MKKTRGLFVVIMVAMGIVLINFNIVLGASESEVVINEFSSYNTSGDWIELYNNGTSEILLDGWSINDSASKIHAFTAGDNISAEGYLVVDVGSRLNRDGDTITLLNGSENIDEVTYSSGAGEAPAPDEGNSTGRYPNGVDTNNDTEDFIVFNTPTPGAPNTIPSVVSIADGSAPLDGSVTIPLMVNNVMDLGAGTINVTYNSSVVHVTNVTSGTGNALTNVSANINNGTNPGWVIISAWDSTEYGKSGDVIFANVTYKAVGAVNDISPLNISVDNLSDINYNDILYTLTNGTFTISSDETPPIVTNASANPSIILNDNGRARPPGTNISILNVTVHDTGSGVSNVTVNLSAIGGSPVQPMERILETDIWTVTTNATYGINLTHELVVNATDKEGNSNTSVAILLEVLKRGDVVRDNKIDMIDALYIVRYTLHFVPEPSVLVSDVVGAGGNPIGDMKVNMKDALYIMRYINGFELEP